MIYLLNCVASCCKLKPTKTPKTAFLGGIFRHVAKHVRFFPVCWLFEYLTLHPSMITPYALTNQNTVEKCQIHWHKHLRSNPSSACGHSDMFDIQCKGLRLSLTDVGMKTSGLRLTLRCSHAAPTSLRLQHCHSGIFFALMQKFRSPHLAIAKDAQHVAWFGLAHNLIIICQHLATKKKPWASQNDYNQDIDFGPLKIIIWEWFLGPPQSRLKVHFWNQEFKR